MWLVPCRRATPTSYEWIPGVSQAVDGIPKDKPLASQKTHPQQGGVVYMGTLSETSEPHLMQSLLERCHLSRTGSQVHCQESCKEPTKKGSSRRRCEAGAWEGRGMGERPPDSSSPPSGALGLPLAGESTELCTDYGIEIFIKMKCLVAQLGKRLI